MGRRLGKSLILVTGFVLVVAACSDDTAETTTSTTIPVVTTTTLPVETTTSTTTTTLPPGGPPLIAEGDRNETVAAFQWLLVCGGHGTLTPDGNFGPTTGTVLTSALAALGFTAPDEDAFAALSRDCADDRPITFEGDDPLIVVGNAAPGDPEIYTILEFDTALIVRRSTGPSPCSTPPTPRSNPKPTPPTPGRSPPPGRSRSSSPPTWCRPRSP
jgi:hypothetical protein